LIVERARPVMACTTASPPHPAARTSSAANNRWPRSSSFEPTAAQRCRMPFYHATDLRLFAQIGNPRRLSHTDARLRSAIPLLSGVS
jgi:hypothetical protein